MLPYKRPLTTFLIGIVLVLAAACDTGQEVDIPTAFVLPTLEPSSTPSNTPTPTHTRTRVPTASPTDTPTSTSTLTATASVTATASASPTFTLTFTPTETATSTLTNTPTATLTPIAPQILSFIASKTTATVGESITLTWNANADQARIEQLNQQSQVVQTFSVTPNGTLAVTIPTGQGTQVIYRLMVERNQQTVSSSIPIAVSCQTNWFFGNEFAQQPGTGCPSGSPVTGAGVFQPFQNGVAVWIASTNKVYGLQQNGSRYLGYSSGWNATTIYDNSNCNPPPPAPQPTGGEFPQNHIGWMYCTTLASAGQWGGASGLLGWGTAPIDATQRTIQTSDTDVFFIDAPGGGVYRFSGGDSGTWQKVK